MGDDGIPGSPNEQKQSPETSSSTWSPNSGNAPRGVSWFTRKHYLIKTKWIGGVSAGVLCLCITVWIISAIGANGGTCTSTRGWWVISLYTSLFLIVVQALILLVVAMRLSRHGTPPSTLSYLLRCSNWWFEY
jgi:hypothetical protein